METDHDFLAALFPNIAAQLRGALSNLHLAAAQLAPSAEREKDPALDARAALLDQSYYRLLRLVNSLSAAADLTSDRPLSLQNKELVDFIGEICDKAGDLTPYLGLELRFVCAKPRHVCAVDPEALERLLYHLLSNAFKFTPAGGTVTVELRVHQKQVLISVTDTGLGISEDRLPTLFDHYLQRDAMDAPPHGLGLGLPLCRRIAEKHGGSLVAESRPGKGSCFTLRIPNRQVNGEVSDIPFDYTGGFNRTLLALADALPPAVFCLRSQG